MLLWSVDFWVRALQVMMDGVLEKLWEEEIKKDVPLPEFMIKKDVTEYTLEDQKALKEYNEKVRILEQDRRKYLVILNDNELKTTIQKNNYIMQINEKVAEMSLMKLKYDFAIKHLRIRILNNKILGLKRLLWQKKIDILRKDMNNFNEYIEKYTLLHEYTEASVADVKQKLEMLQHKDKAMDKFFKGHFLNTVPPAVTHEMLKLYRKRVKMTQKSFIYSMICFEVAHRLLYKAGRTDFPLPQEVMDYLQAIDAMDSIQNCPSQVDAKLWDQLVKLRRQKIENELRIKGTTNKFLDIQNSVNSFAKDMANLKTKKQEVAEFLNNTIAEYVSID